MSAPASAMAKPASMLADRSVRWPPSLKLSGVTFRMPMTRGHCRLSPAQEAAHEANGGDIGGLPKVWTRNSGPERALAQEKLCSVGEADPDEAHSKGASHGHMPAVSATVA